MRTCEAVEGKVDTAFYAHFKIEADSPLEIINNSFFHMKLDEIKIKYAKAKVPSSIWYEPWTLFDKEKDDKLNMNFEIIFKSSFVSCSGEIFSEITPGTFCMALRDIPLNPLDNNYLSYRENILGTQLEGKSFLVPRSCSYHYNKDGEFKQCYSQGEYSVIINIIESARAKFLFKNYSN